MRRSFASVLLSVAVILLVLTSAFPAIGQQRQEEVLPPRGVVIEIDSPDRSLYRIAVPQLRGDAALGGPSAEVMQNDFRLISLFQVLDARSFLANLEQEGINITAQPWSAVGAQGVVKGEIRNAGGQLTVEMRFYEIARGTTAVISKTYRGPVGQLRGFMHDFANEVVRHLTGELGPFGSRLAFARRVGPGRKDVYVSDFDGHGVARVSSGRGVSMLPSFGPGGVWYSVMSPLGMFITRGGNNERPIIDGDGLNMGPVVCGGRVLFSSTRDGNSEIYSAAIDGSDVRRLTRAPGIDVSPSCGPGGQIAFVSDRHGGPQIFVMDANGGTPRRVTFRGSHNQTPAYCPDARTPLIAFTGRDAGMDIFTVNTQTGEYKRLTQGQGTNKDPAFSPDCRMVAFASSRGGIFVSNPEGLNQTRVVEGNAETVRWSR